MDGPWSCCVGSWFVRQQRLLFGHVISSVGAKLTMFARPEQRPVGFAFDPLGTIGLRMPHVDCHCVRTGWRCGPQRLVESCPIARAAACREFSLLSDPIPAVAPGGSVLTLRVAIVDHPDTPHARMMQACVRAVSGRDLEITWIAPSYALAAELDALQGVSVTAVPIRVVGGHRDDHFTRGVMEALVRLRRRGTHVFVAAGNRRSNALGQAGTAVAALGAHRTWGSGLRTGRPELGSSGACARAAGVAALLRTRRCHWRRSHNPIVAYIQE